MEVDYEALPLMTMYRAADALWKHSTRIEQTLFTRITDLFGFSTTITLYDLTNTLFRGRSAAQYESPAWTLKRKTHGLSAGDAGFSLGRQRPFDVAQDRPCAPFSDLCR
jgi:hypothetical protein